MINLSKLKLGDKVYFIQNNNIRELKICYIEETQTIINCYESDKIDGYVINRIESKPNRDEYRSLTVKGFLRFDNDIIKKECNNSCKGTLCEKCSGCQYLIFEHKFYYTKEEAERVIKATNTRKNKNKLLKSSSFKFWFSDVCV